MRRLFLFSVMGLWGLGFLPSVRAGDVIDIGSRRELFVDRLLISRLVGADLELKQPVPAGIAVRFDDPWEGPLAFYSTVFKDGDKYRLYYRGLYGKVGTTCYAESLDGIHWTKPELGLVSIDGSTKNGVILPSSGQFCPFIDRRPGVPDSERYKANSRGPEDPHALIGYVSADGLRWRQIQEEPIVPMALVNNFDSQNVMFWSEVEKQYVLYARHMEGGRRATARATSPDFRNWSQQTLMTYSDTGTTTPSAQFYTNQTQPYFRAPHIYISLPARILFADEGSINREDDIEAARRQALTVTPELREFVIEHMKPMGTRGTGDRSDAVLMTSRAGTTRFDFTLRESLIRPGIGINNWTTRTNYPVCGVVQTGPEEMSLYVQRDYGQKTAHLERMTLRLDGFASLNAPYQGGEMLTHPLKFSGSRLEINYSTSAAGGLRVEIQDAQGQPIPGFSLAECPEILGDEIQRIVSWEVGSDVSSLAGKTVRLRFVMKDADLYSIRFH